VARLAHPGAGRSAYAAVLSTPIPGVGQRLGLCVADGHVVGVDLLGPGDTPPVPPAGTVTAEAVRQLAAYFRDPTRPLDLPVRPAGTAFQRRVWQALARIPPGQTVTYGELARRLGTAARAVGQACRANPLPLLIPCHRVVSAHGPGGYAGALGGPWVAVKDWLLAHERAGTR
jgi:methylated-DNA-[protein]-cysteine S-methyltransferase